MIEARHPECPDVHMGSCPKCERLWKRDETIPEASISVQAPRGVEVRMDTGVAEADGKASDAPPQTKQQRYYARKRQDPEWLKREAARKRRERAK